MSSEKDIVMNENDDSHDTNTQSSHSKVKKSSKEKEKPNNLSKKSHKKSRKSSDIKDSKTSKKNKSKKKDPTSDSKIKAGSKKKSKPKAKRKKKRSLSPSSHSRSRSPSNSHSRSRDRKRRRSRSRSPRYSRSNYNRRSYSRSPSPYRPHKRHRKDTDRRRRRYKRARRHRSRSRTRSRSLSSSQSTTNKTTNTKTKSKTDMNNPNGSKVAEIKATAPNAMQQTDGGRQIADPLAAFSSVFGGFSRPAVLALTNPVQQSNAALQQLLSGAANPYKLNCGLSGTANTINPILMNKVAAELRKSAMEQQTKTAAAKLAEVKKDNLTDNKSSDDSLFFTVHLPGMNTLTAIGGIHPQITRPARRLYVGNLPVGMGLTEQILTEFFGQCCKGLGIATVNPVLSVWLNSEQTFGFIEFRSVQDTNLALQLFDGLQLGGRQLRFGRPVDYKEPPDNLRNYVVGEHGAGGANVASNANNIERGSPAAMLVLQQQRQTDALQNVLGSQQQDLAKKTLNVAISTKQKAMLEAMIDGDVEMKEDMDVDMESTVLLLLNMLSADDIGDDDEYADILDDIQCECESYGNLLEVVVPRCGEKGCGRVFLKYADLSQARKCKSKVDGRKFGANIVKCVYFEERLFNAKEYDHKLD